MHRVFPYSYPRRGIFRGKRLQFIFPGSIAQPNGGAAEWQGARDQFSIKEKAATKAHDALSAGWRRLPMVRIGATHVPNRSD